MCESIKINFVLLFWLTSKFLAINSNKESPSRQIRTPFYTPYQSGIGFAVALAIPLDNGRADIFLSFCIGTGYGQPQLTIPDAPGLDPPIFTTIYEDKLDARRLKGDASIENNKNLKKTKLKSKKKRPTRKGVLTRKRFFRLFADNLKQNGFDAHFCLLRVICETAQHNFGYRNGVLGDLIHILFTPTSSQDEQLDTIYYEAQENGQRNLCESKYSDSCPISVFDLITIIK